jgi:hypothetical protein
MPGMHCKYDVPFHFYMDPFDGELWHCFAPQDAKHVLVVDNTEHLTRAASVRLHIPELLASTVNGLEFTGEDVLATLVCTQHSKNESRKQYTIVPLQGSKVRSFLWTENCSLQSATMEEYMQKRMFDENNRDLTLIIKKHLVDVQDQLVIEKERSTPALEEYMQMLSDFRRMWNSKMAAYCYVKDYSQRKEEFEHSRDIPTILKDANFFLGLIGETAQNPESLEELLPKFEERFKDVYYAIICRPQRLQTSDFASSKFRQDRLMMQRNYLLGLESCPEKQSRAISERPVYKEDILALAMQDPSFCEFIRSAVGESDQAHLVLFSSPDACRVCLGKADSLTGALASALSSSTKHVPVSTLYFTGRFRPAVAGEDSSGRASLIPPHARADFELVVPAMAEAAAEGLALAQGGPLARPTAQPPSPGDWARPAQSEWWTATTLPSTCS